MTRKEIAILFCEKAAAGTVGEVFARHASPRFVHHNPYFPSDGPSLQAAIEENARKNPGKTLKVHHALEDGDLVAVHSHVRHNAQEKGFALLHLFRFEGDKIAELWDIAMEVPEQSANALGMF